MTATSVLDAPVLDAPALDSPALGSPTLDTPARDERAYLDKAVSLLVALSEADGAAGVSELARRTGLSKSTAFRLLGTLERTRAVVRDGRGYRLGGLLHALGSNVFSPTVEALRDTLTPHLVELYEATRHPVHLATLHGNHVVYLNKLYGRRGTSTPSRVGSTAPAHCTAVGKALLAFDVRAADAVLAGPLPARTPASLTDPAALQGELARIRRSGLAVANEEALPGLYCLAVPVLDRSGRAVAALSVSGPADRPTHLGYADVLRRIGFEASRTVRARAAG